jgi:isoleucyl-tRNA synthetase
MDFRATLNLPDPNFGLPMRANLPTLEPKIQEGWNKASTYKRIQSIRGSSPRFLLHDGPPYTNSAIHIGTALNKILKDFTVKSRLLMGYRTPYVPGFDNHGLPIEQSVMKKFAEKKIRPTTVELRQACRAHAQEFIELQSKQFQRLGVFGHWDQPYRTMDYRFEAEILRVFKALVEGGYIYKGLRPTLWSPTSQTALADTEIIYHEVTSKAIHVRFPLREAKHHWDRGLENVYTIIWTTTPWTIPANLAVAFHPEATYAVVRVGGDHYVIAKDLVEKVGATLGWTNAEIVAEHPGKTFEHSRFGHPIFDRDSLGVVADYVTMEDGTGVVHTAPGHGRDDFYTGQRYDLPVLTPVDARGVLTDDAGEFAGVSYKECDTVVVNRLREVGALLHEADFLHKYPHAERDDKPVIFRATEQWFFGLDRHGLREHILNQIPEVTWLPESGQARIESMIRNRPDWCISRQRPWGVGIPIFYGKKSRVPVLDPVAIECVANLVEHKGSDAWFEADPADILPHGYVHPETGETEFEKETDVLDVWFDSGSTWYVVLASGANPIWTEEVPADLYLEGSDQHRGWFNSSLLISSAMTGNPPYKAVLTHGFITDEKGQKMSKRLGNVVDPVVASDQHGADVIRYWASTIDYTNDAPCSESLIKNAGDHYRRVRNTLRFLMANVEGFSGDFSVAGVRAGGLLPIDEWLVEQVDMLAVDVADAYGRYDFDQALRSVHDFCVNELSKFYIDAIKDRMYCNAKDDPSRRSGQLACLFALVQLTKLVAPVLCHTAEEVWDLMVLNGFVRDNEAHSIFAETFDLPDEDRMESIRASALQTSFATLLGVRSNIFAAFEAWKAEADVKDSQDVCVTIYEDQATVDELSRFDPYELANFLKMSWFELRVADEDAYTFEKSEFLKCERSRLRRPDVEMVGEHALSRRDRAVLNL